MNKNYLLLIVFFGSLLFSSFLVVADPCMSVQRNSFDVPFDDSGTITGYVETVDYDDDTGYLLVELTWDNVNHWYEFYNVSYDDFDTFDDNKNDQRSLHIDYIDFCDGSSCECYITNIEVNDDDLPFLGFILGIAVVLIALLIIALFA